MFFAWDACEIDCYKEKTPGRRTHPEEGKSKQTGLRADLLKDDHAEKATFLFLSVSTSDLAVGLRYMNYCSPDFPLCQLVSWEDVVACGRARCGDWSCSSSFFLFFRGHGRCVGGEVQDIVVPFS